VAIAIFPSPRAAATAAPAERWDPGSPRAPATKPPRKRQLEALQEQFGGERVVDQ